MRHWNDLDRDCAAPARLGEADRRRLEAALSGVERPARRTARPEPASWIGLTLALAFLAGMAWAVAPTSPVAKEVRR
jgi:hypothetical protein